MEPLAAPALIAEELDRDAFARARGEWDALLARSGRDEPFFRHGFLRLWIDNFAPDVRLRLFAAREGGRLVAALPLLETEGTMYGVPLRLWRAPANVHSCRFDLVCASGEAGEAGLRAVWSHLRATGGFDVLELPDVPEGGASHRLVELARDGGLGVSRWEASRTPYIEIADGWEALQKRLDGHFRSNLRRRRRKLQARGQVSFERCEGGEELERFLEEGLQLEQSGWKGRGGTAIGLDPLLRGFYAEWARQAAYGGELALSLLRLDGRPVAFQFGLISGAVYYLPKTAYDERHADCSPGQLLMEEVLRDCCARGLRRFDFLGPSMSWKRDWTDRERPHHWLHIFADSPRGRLLHQLKARWVPALKERLKWKPSTTPADA